MQQSIKAHGRTFTGTVIRARMQNTATIEWTQWRYVPKFERYERRKTTVKAHNPPDIDAKEGDVVVIQQCRPISKTKQFTITKKVGHERLYEAKKELEEQSKVKQEKPPKTESKTPEEEQ